MMNETTLGNTPALIYGMKILKDEPQNIQKRISNVIHELHTHLNIIKTMKNDLTVKYVLTLVKKDYLQKIELIKFNNVIAKTCFKNYVIAKLRSIGYHN